MENIRNVCIISHVDHGKSTLSDTFLAKGGLISEDDIGVKRATDSREDEKERGITIKSTGVSMNVYHNGEKYKLNMIDTPGHVDFNSEVTAALRIADGAVVVIDSVEGVSVQTETVLRQALAEKVRPILYVNKMDRYLFEVCYDAETAYQKLFSIIAKVNDIIQTYSSDKDYVLSPEKGNVFFGSAIHRWGFSLKNFAESYSKKSGGKLDTDGYMKYLWGEYYYDKTKGSFSSKSNSGERSFNYLIYRPLQELHKSIMSNDTEKIQKIIKSLGIELIPADLSKKEKDLYKVVFRKWLPLGTNLLDGVITYLPNPKVAQESRVDVLISAPPDHESYLAIKNCDPKGPLMIYISKMIPTGEGGRFFAFGRIFSGTVVAGQKVTVLADSFEYGGKDDISTNINVRNVLLLINNKQESVSELECGNTVGLIGVDGTLRKSGTITTVSDPYPIKTMKFSVSPVVQVAVSVKNAADLPKLVEACKRLGKSDTSILIKYDDNTGETIVAGVGELHLEICLNDLRGFLGSDLIVSKPVVPFQETITKAVTTPMLAKSPNRHNRLYMTAEPLPLELVKRLADEPKLSKNSGELEKVLVNEFGWDSTDAKRVWSVGPEENPTNILVDCTRGISYLNEIREAVISGFKIANRQGVLAKEPVRGVRYNVVDVTLHADAIHRGIGQIQPCAIRSVYACQLSGDPVLIEPLYSINVTVPEQYIGTIYSILSQKRGSVTNEERNEGTPITVIEGILPVLESFGIDSLLKKETSGQGLSQLAFKEWTIYKCGDLRDSTSIMYKLIQEIRKNKDCDKLEVPLLEEYLDKL
jgi:elongation factor 2